MALTINTNVASLNAQRNLGKSQMDLNKSMQRLSSGLRINSAKDDAAGLAITDRMTAQIRGLNQASRNANDAISLAQTAEGALQESTNILQRMRELAVQASNDTNTSADRTSLNAEVAQLLAEINRIAQTTSFNGQTLLAGAFSGSGNGAVFQVGANAAQTIEVNIGAATQSALGLAATAFSASTSVVVDSTSTAFSVSGGVSASYTITSDAIDGAGAVIFSDTAGNLSISGAGGSVSGFGGIASTGGGALSYSGNGLIASTGAGALSLSTESISVGGNISISGGTSVSFVTSVNVVASTSLYNDTSGGVTVATFSGAQAAITSIDTAINTIDTIRGDLGAVQNRFESTISNLQNVAENLTAARSRILDADIAQETSSMTKMNILQQAGVSILAQANQAPQLALSLLG